MNYLTHFLLSIYLMAFPPITDQEVYRCPPCNSACDKIIFNEAGSCNHCGMELITQTQFEKMEKNDKLKIAFYLQDGVEIFDFAGPMGVFSYAGYEIFTVSKTKEPIYAQRVLKVIPDYSIKDAPQADIISFYGGNSSETLSDPEVIEWIESQQNVDYHFSVCTGALFLAEAGILNGKTATTFHDAIGNLSKYEKVDVRNDVRYVDNGKVITTAGISAGTDGALHLVAKLESLPTAQRIAYHMEYDKWQPGEGLILSTDNPYKKMLLENDLKKYCGVYEYKNNTTVEVKVKGKNQLVAYFKEGQLPLFYVNQNEFITPANITTKFIEIEGEIIGYKIEGKQFSKLKK